MSDELERMGATARALIETGRTIDDPSERDRARVRARLTAALGVSAVTAAGTQAAAASLAEGAATAASGGGLGTSAAANGGLGASAAGATAGSAVAGSAIGATGTVASGAGAATAAASGGLFAALGSKIVIASVMAATAVGAVVGADTLLRSTEPSVAELPAPSATQTPIGANPRNATDAKRDGHEAAAALSVSQAGARTSDLSRRAASPSSSLPNAPPSAAEPGATSIRASLEQRSDAVSSAPAPRSRSRSIESSSPADPRAGTGVRGKDRTAAPMPAIDASGSHASRAAGLISPPAVAKTARDESPTNLAGLTTAVNASATPNAPSANAPTSVAPAARESTANGATGLIAAQASATVPTDAAPVKPASIAAPELPKPPALSGEIKLLASAQQALRDNQLARALTLLNEHATRYPRGALRPERLAARAVALCRMGERNLGRAEVQKLEAETPSSPLIRWARGICGL